MKNTLEITILSGLYVMLTVLTFISGCIYVDLIQEMAKKLAE